VACQSSVAAWRRKNITARHAPCQQPDHDATRRRDHRANPRNGWESDGNGNLFLHPAARFALVQSYVVVQQPA